MKNTDNQSVFDIPKNESIAIKFFEWLGWTHMRIFCLAEKSSESPFFGIPADVSFQIWTSFWNECFPDFPKEPIRKVKNIVGDLPSTGFLFNEDF